MKSLVTRGAKALSFGLLAAIGFANGPARAAQAIPAPPSDGRLIADYADLLSFVGETTVEGSQQKALRENETPIVVVTIRQMADYDVAAAGIEEFAKAWFDRWGIGTLNAPGGGSNKGILLLVSELDRRARIELGGDWGRDWDRQARKIMDESIVPKFRAGNFNDGIDRGVAALAEMAATGPAGRAPSIPLSERLAESAVGRSLATLVGRANSLSEFGPMSFSLLLLLGLGLVGASFAFPGRRRLLLMAGVSLVGLAAFTYAGIALLAVIAALMLARSGGLTTDDGSRRRSWSGSSDWGGSSSWSSSSGSSGSSGYSGGSSGGGGATGSW